MPLSSNISCRILSGSHCHPPAMRIRPPGWFWRMARIASISSWPASSSHGAWHGPHSPGCMGNNPIPPRTLLGVLLTFG